MSDDAFDPPQEAAGLDVVRRSASHQIDRLAASNTVATEQLVKTSAWLTGALLTLNGGGVLSTLSYAEHAPGQGWPAGFFLGGIALAMLSAVAIQGFQSVLFAPLENLMAYWRWVEISGVEHHEAADEHYAKIKRTERLAFVPPLLGWLSGMTFFAGAVMLALHVEQDGRQNAVRCRSLQADMLAAKPLRADSRDLFTALGCKPSDAAYSQPPLHR